MTLKTADLDLAESVADEARPVLRRRRAGFLARDTRSAYWFIAPAFMLLAFLVAYPFVLSVWFSLSDARVGTSGSFVGLGNFGRLFSSSIFQQTLQNSFVFTAAALGAKIVLGMALALLLFRVTRFKRLIRGAVLLPFIVPTALSTLVWWWMFEPMYSVVNWTLKSLLVTPVLGVVILFSAIFTLSDFNIVYVLTKGGPMNMTHLFATYSFTLGLQGGEIGMGAAVSLFLFPILLAVVFLQLRLMRRAAIYE
jgi:ABC-type sugar transport system permease subunit